MNAIAPGERRIATLERRSQIYVAAGGLTTVIALIGFWPTYFGPLLVGQVEGTLIVHVHAAVQVAWLALFIAQILLASTGHRALHIKLGRWVMAYGVVVIFVGVVLSFDVFGRHVSMGDAATGQRFLFNFLRELLFVAPFLGAGWICRNKPETHKRLMIVATVMMTVPAVGRMRVFLGGSVELWEYMLIWPLPVYLLMVNDFAKKRLVHPVYLIGTVAMVGERLVLPLRATTTWLAVSGWFVPWYQTAPGGG